MFSAINLTLRQKFPGLFIHGHAESDVTKSIRIHDPHKGKCFILKNDNCSLAPIMLIFKNISVCDLSRMKRSVSTKKWASSQDGIQKRVKDTQPEEKG